MNNKNSSVECNYVYFCNRNVKMKVKGSLWNYF